MQTPSPLLTQVPELLAPYQARLAVARRRQAAVWRGERPDAWPLLLSGPLTPVQEQLPDGNLAEAFNDADRMLGSQLRGVFAVANGGADQVPSIRANLGTGICCACLGLEQDVFADKMPWLRQHLTKEQISRLTPDDLVPRGSFERGLYYMRYFKEMLGDSVGIYCMDTQGPFDLAHLIMGDAFFYELHDDPPFVHHLMELSLALGIRTHTWMKELTGEPLERHHHSGMLYAENMGIRICEDTTAIVGPKVMDEFAMPYTQRLARHFGGAWVHYCGRSDELTRRILALPEIRGINFGHIPGHEHDHLFEQDMEWIRAAGKVYIGGWPRRPGEPGREYLRRLHRWSAQGCLIADGNAAMYPADGLADAAAVREFWYGL